MTDKPRLDRPCRLLLAARLSTKPKHTDRMGIGIETQDEHARDWAEAQHPFETRDAIYTGIEIVDVAADTASGRKQPWERKNLKPWVTKPERLITIDGYLAFDMTRLTRAEWDDENEIRRRATQHGKVLVIANGPQWPPRHDGDFWQWTALAKQAHDELVAIMERCARDRAGIIANGGAVDRVPFGYTYEGPMYGKYPVTTPNGEKYVPQIFQKVADGEKVPEICDWLDSEHVPPERREADRWDPRTIYRMIHNTAYYGSQRNKQGQQIRELPVLVDRKLWRAANAKLKERKPGRRAPVKRQTALLTGVLFCGRCRRNRKTSKMYRRTLDGLDHYTCNGSGRNSKGCGGIVLERVADTMVDTYLSQAVGPWIEFRMEPGTSYAVDRADVEMRLRDLATLGLSDEEEDAERKRLRAERDAIPEKEEGPHISKHETDQSIGQHWASLKDDFEGRRELLLENVKVYIDSLHARRNGKPVWPPMEIDSRLFQVPQRVRWQSLRHGKA